MRSSDLSVFGLEIPEDADQINLAWAENVTWSFHKMGYKRQFVGAATRIYQTLVPLNRVKASKTHVQLNVMGQYQVLQKRMLCSISINR